MAANNNSTHDDNKDKYSNTHNNMNKKSDPSNTNNGSTPTAAKDNDNEEARLGLEEEFQEKAYDSRLMKRLLRYARPYWKEFAGAMALLIAITLIDLAGPYLIKVAIDNHILRNPDPSAVTRLGLIYVGIVALGFLFNYLQITILIYAGQNIIFNFRQQIFTHLQRMPLGFFDKNPVGRLVTRVTNDTEALNEMYTNVLLTFLKDFMIVGGVLLVMLQMNWRLALFVLASIPVLLILTATFRTKAREVYRKVRTSLAAINSAFSENISGMRVIQIFQKEGQSFQKFQEINRKYFKAGMNEIVVTGIFRPAIEILSYLVVALILWFGGIRVLDGTLEFGVLFAFVNYINLFFQPINDLAEKYNVLQSAMASSERIFQLLDEPEEMDEGTKVLRREDLKGTIEFKDVSFAYNEGDYVLKNVSFSVPAGKTLAIVGATGAGKSSIINLINRFYEIQEGTISIDGVDIKDYKKESLRKEIGMVLQDVFLFSGNIKDNIRLSSPNISDEKLRTAAEYVNAGKFIDSLPKGYEEEVKERGSTLSTGQRQLLAFARALAFDPSILILDEATASVDTETELLIQDALAKLTKNRTTIVIAHRLSTIQHADNIMVLHKGRIREMGTHQELLAGKGIYHNLYNLQYKG